MSNTERLQYLLGRVDEGLPPLLTDIVIQEVSRVITAELDAGRSPEEIAVVTELTPELVSRAAFKHRTEGVNEAVLEAELGMSGPEYIDSILATSTEDIWWAFNRTTTPTFGTRGRGKTFQNWLEGWDG